MANKHMGVTFNKHMGVTFKYIAELKGYQIKDRNGEAVYMSLDAAIQDLMEHMYRAGWNALAQELVKRIEKLEVKE